MKKKLIVVVAIVALIAVLAGVFTACHKRERIVDIDISKDYNAEEVEENLNALKDDGIFVNLKVAVEAASSSEDSEDLTKAFNFAYGAKGDLYYYCVGDESTEVYLDFNNDDRYEVYTRIGADGEWEKTVTYYTEDETEEDAKEAELDDASLAGVWGYLSQYRGFGEGKGTKSSARLDSCGRDCDVYKYRDGKWIPFVANIKLEQEVWIDKATGACLKYTAYSSAKAGDSAVSGSVSFECTAFSTAWTPTLPQVDEEHTRVYNQPQE